MMSLPASKGFEIGSGFAGTDLTGLEHNDAFYMEGDRVRTRTNRSGGVQGGITNGETIYFRVAFKPTATVMREQDTVSAQGEDTTITGRGRHDPCVLPRAVPMVEAMAALVLADHALRTRSDPTPERARPAPRPGGTDRPPVLSARPPIRPHGRGSAAAARRRGSVADGDAFANAVVQLVADALHLAQVVRRGEGRLGAMLDDGLRLRRVRCPAASASSAADAVFRFTRALGPGFHRPGRGAQQRGARRGPPPPSFSIASSQPPPWRLCGRRTATTDRKARTRRLSRRNPDPEVAVAGGLQHALQRSVAEAGGHLPFHEHLCYSPEPHVGGHLHGV